jgi:hypothetical protein
MSGDGGSKHCLWHAEDGRCANCKARRIRCDVLKFEDYDYCSPERDYDSCDFFIQKPVKPGS